MAEISKEYGAAIFMLACENNAKKEYGEALLKIKDMFLENPEYPEFLASPGIPMSERLKALETAFAKDVPENVLSFISLLCEKGRIACFFEAVSEYESLLAESERVLNAKVTSAVSLTEDEKEKLKKKLEDVNKSRVDLEFFIDETILGGIIVEIDGKILDGSIKSRLRDIKDVINS